VIDTASDIQSMDCILLQNGSNSSNLMNNNLRGIVEVEVGNVWRLKNAQRHEKMETGMNITTCD